MIASRQQVLNAYALSPARSLPWSPHWKDELDHFTRQCSGVRRRGISRSCPPLNGWDGLALNPLRNVNATRINSLTDPLF